MQRTQQLCVRPIDVSPLKQKLRHNALDLVAFYTSHLQK